MSLPSGYKQLEYIQSTGTQYIDTGFIPNQDTRIDIIAVPMSVEEAANGVGFIPYGVGNSFDDAAFECYTHNYQYEFNFGTSYDVIGSAVIGQKVVISHNKNNINLTINDGTPLELTLTSSTFTAPRNLILFGINRSTPLLGLLRLYSCQIYDNGTLVRDFVPCKKSDGTLGLFDIINNVFYTNQGTGSFIGSPIIEKGAIIDYDYLGFADSIKLPPGIYRLEAWGAQGGSYSTATGGAGGYSIGTLTIDEDTTIYIYVGGAGSSSTTSGSFVQGGFNGGGNAGYRYGGSGGGGSDIRLSTDSLYSRVIVAGGGGGGWGYKNYVGGVGGGTDGGSGTGYSSSKLATPGTATSGGAGNGYSSSYSGSDGSFGVGGNGSTYSSSYNRSSGGGGGWYGGGGSGFRSNSSYYYYGGGGAGGGSGYVYTADTSSNYPSGCLLNSTYYLTDASTTDGSNSFTSPTGSTETGHTGNGYIRITIIDVKSLNIPVKINDNWKDCGNVFVKVDGAWKTVDKAYANINGTWKEISA